MIPLLASPSPRDIPEVRKNLETIPCDKLLVKYHHAKRAYKIIRSYFLDHTDYDYLIIHPDDLVVNERHFNELKDDIQRYNYPVLSGICNGDMKPPLDNVLAVTLTRLPHRNRHLRKYDFVSMYGVVIGIHQVAWAGFPFMWIRRDVVEQIELEDDSKWNNHNKRNSDMGWAVDVVFANRCHELGIPIHVDFDVLMRHLRSDFTIEGSDFKTGIEKPRIKSLNVINEEIDITDYCHERYLTQEDWQKYPQQNNRTQEVIYI